MSNTMNFVHYGNNVNMATWAVKYITIFTVQNLTWIDSCLPVV